VSACPPGDADRTGPIGALGGELTSWWDYNEADREWAEDYLLGGLGVTVSNFTTATIDQFLEDVVQRTDTDPVKHMRLAALQRPAARCTATAQNGRSGRPRTRCWPTGAWLRRDCARLSARLT
jgi:hypothetical protein